MKLHLNQYRDVLVAYLQPVRRQVLLLTLLLLGGVGLQLLNPQILAFFIDTAMAGGAFSRLIQAALLFLGVALATQLISVAEAYVAADVALKATNQLRADLASHCLSLDMGFHNERTPGELIERVDGDVNTLNNFFSRFAVQLLSSAILLLGVLVLLFRVDWRVGVAMSLFALLTLLIINRLRDVAVPHFRATRQARALLFGFLEERLSGTEDVRAGGGTAYVMRRFFERSRDYWRKDLKAHLISLGAFGTSNVLFAVGVMLALTLGIYLFQQGAITIGVVYLIFRYTDLLNEPIEAINRQIQDLQQAGAAIVRIYDLLAIKSGLSDVGQLPLPTGPLAVEFKGVSFRYTPSETGTNGKTTTDLVLDDISFVLTPGTKLGLLGRTGSGKTTLTRLLFRFYDPAQGAIHLAGQPLPDLSVVALRRNVGLVTQEIQLFHASVRDNLTLFDPAIADGPILETLQRLGLWDWYQTLPQGLDTKLAPGGSGLSAGQAQLLAFVRVFLKDPGLVILDEASSRLDPATERLLERAIDRLLEGRTAIIIAHRLATVQRVDQIMILQNGRCLEYGRRDDLAHDARSRFAGLLQTGLEEALA